MTKEFKVGDKVCSIGMGNGFVESINDRQEYPLCVNFDERRSCFGYNGKYVYNDPYPSLYHGHGTFQFIPEPEHEYTWQWLFISKFDEEYYTSVPCKSEAEFIEVICCTPKWYQRIEESKRKV